MDDTWVRRLLCSFMQEGCILLAEHDEQVIGMLIAQTQPDPWLPHSQNTQREWHGG
jgi:hypothetical protein